MSASPNGMNGIPLTLRELLSKLYFLSMIKKGKKPCMTNMSFVDVDSWYGAFYRSNNSESKDTVMMQIEKIIDETIQALANYEGGEFVPIIIRALDEAKVGISELSETYREFPHTVAKIKVCLENIQLQLDRHPDCFRGEEEDDDGKRKRKKPKNKKPDEDDSPTEERSDDPPTDDKRKSKGKKKATSPVLEPISSPQVPPPLPPAPVGSSLPLPPPSTPKPPPPKRG